LKVVELHVLETVVVLVQAKEHKEANHDETKDDKGSDWIPGITCFLPNRLYGRRKAFQAIGPFK